MQRTHLLHVLLAEDNLVSRRIAATLLEKQGHTVTAVEDGHAAVEAFVAQPDAFDVVLMDVEMPGMDGFEATAAIRRKEQQTGGRVRILALTAHADESVRGRCLAADMDGHVPKPIDVATLLAAVEWPGDERHAVADEAPGAGGPQGGGEVQWDEALALVDGDSVLLLRMAELLVQSLGGLTDDVRRAAAREDARALQQAAHRLGGAISHFRCAAADSAAQRLQDTGAAGELDGVEDLLNALGTAIDRLRGDLEERIAAGNTVP